MKLKLEMETRSYHDCTTRRWCNGGGCMYECVCVCVCVCVFLCAYVSVNIVPTVAADDAWPERKSELA